jgi:hypothetical protein
VGWALTWSNGSKPNDFLSFSPFSPELHPISSLSFSSLFLFLCRMFLPSSFLSLLFSSLTFQPSLLFLSFFFFLSFFSLPLLLFPCSFLSFFLFYSSSLFFPSRGYLLLLSFSLFIFSNFFLFSILPARALHLYFFFFFSFLSFFFLLAAAFFHSSFIFLCFFFFLHSFIAGQQLKLDFWAEENSTGRRQSGEAAWVLDGDGSAVKAAATRGWQQLIELVAAPARGQSGDDLCGSEGDGWVNRR